MADDLTPTFAIAKALDEPETGWAGYLVWLSMSPRTEGGVLDVCASAVVQPYRKLKDGSIEVAPERLRKSFSFGSLREERLKNDGAGTAFSRVMDDVVAVLRTALAKV